MREKLRRRVLRVLNEWGEGLGGRRETADPTVSAPNLANMKKEKKEYDNNER